MDADHGWVMGMCSNSRVPLLPIECSSVIDEVVIRHGTGQGLREP
jgi:hypothetical protein